MSIEILNKLHDRGLDLKELKSGKVLCPNCNGKGSQGFEGNTLSVTVDEKGVVWYCNRQNKCGFTGNYQFPNPIIDFRKSIKPKKYVKHSFKLIDGELDDITKKWFLNRGLDANTLEHFKVTTKLRYDYATQQNRPWVAMPYLDLENKLTNVKYRTIADKQFAQEKDSEQTFYGLGQIGKDAKGILYIVEGEIDALSLYQAGYKNVVSIPNGGISPKSVGKLSQSSDKFHFLNHAGGWLDNFEHFVLACDFDDVGKAVMEELARRLGRDKCWRVHWPNKQNTEIIKDANDVLRHLGVEELQNVIDGAEPWPIADVYSIKDYASEVFKLYNNEYEPPLSTGFYNLDESMKIRTGDVSVVTGIPNSGKSEFMDAIMLNMINKHKWKFGVCSFENPPKFHIAKLCEKEIGAPFFGDMAGRPRISKTELQTAMTKLNTSVKFIRCDSPDDRPPTIDWIVDRAKNLVRQVGINGLIIDPYNEIESTRANNLSETEFISLLLSKLKRFAQTYDVHVWIIAHPRKMNAVDGVIPVVGLYDISGSAHWANKADLGWCVTRDRHNPSLPVEVHILKVRFKECGTSGGVAKFSWDKASGRYTEFVENEKEFQKAGNYYQD